MRSSISNSNRHSIRNAVIAFAVTFFICAGLGLLFHHYFPLESWIGNLPALDKGDGYMVMEADSDQAFDLYAMYYGIENSTREAQKADVLILGNSKPFFAFRNEPVKAFTEKTEIRVFNLSVPYGDGLAMARAFIDRLRLSPSIIVINENHFFGSKFSPYGEETLKMGYCQAFLKVVEHNISWFLRSHLHRLFPRMGLGKIYGADPVVAYRSVQTGCLVSGNFDENPVPVASHGYGQETLSPDEFKNAGRFIQEMKSRGIKIILTSVPYGTDETGRLDRWIKNDEKRMLISKAEEPYQNVEAAARLLGLPLIVVKPDEMETFDGRHLDEKSGLQFARLFFNEFLKRPEVKALLNSRKPIN